MITFRTGVLFSLFCCSLWAQPAPLSAESGTFEVGVFVSLTGDCADVGEISRKGLELAVEEINSTGGVLGRPVHLTVQDSREAASVNAVSAYRNLLLNSAIHYLVGPSCSPAGLAVAPIAARNDSVVVASPSIGLLEFNEAGDNIFKLWPYDEDGPKLLAKYAIDHGWKRAALFSSQQAWEEAQGNFFEAEFKRLGGTVVAKVNPVPSVTDLNPEALRLVGAKPDVVVLSDYIHFDLSSKALAKQHYAGPKLSTLMTGEKIAQAEGALEGTIAYGYDSASPAFVEKFKLKFGRAPWSIGADTSYDYLHLLAKTINENKSEDPLLIRKKLIEVREYPGVSGAFSFDLKGGIARQPKLFVVRGTELSPLH